MVAQIVDAGKLLRSASSKNAGNPFGVHISEKAATVRVGEAVFIQTAFSYPFFYPKNNSCELFF